MEQTDWEITAMRFVAFFDIMGFKELVERKSHSEVVTKLRQLKTAIGQAEKPDGLIAEKLDFGQTKTITFSDSIIIFSKSDTEKDANKILVDSSWLLYKAIEFGLGIKGAISY